MSMTTELAQRMKAAALKATPGEWVYLPSNTSIEYDYGSDDSQGSITYMVSGDFTQKQTELNGIFIALANPANALALVEALEARDKQIAAQRGIISSARKFISECAGFGDVGAAEFIKIIDRATGVAVEGDTNANNN